MNSKRFGYFLFKHDSDLRSRAFVLLAFSLALGIAALVALDAFTRRIEATVKANSKSLLAADFQVQAWRAFDDNVWKAVEDEKRNQNTVLQSDFLSALSLGPDSTVTVSVRVLEGERYPFYGEWKTDPMVVLSDLESEPRIVLDKSFRAKGVVIGQRVRLGKIEFKVHAFLEQEPQTVAGAFATGPRVIVHRKWGLQTGLMERGARVFNQLLIKSSLSSEEFKKKFRAVVPDPHWRLITPEHANRQVDKILGRLRGFLSFVGLTGLFLGGVGLFMVFRAQFMLRLSGFLSLRCLGARRESLYVYALLNSSGVAVLGWLPRTLLGYGAEAALKIFAAQKFGIELADISYVPSLILGFVLSVACVLVAVLLPMTEILRVPTAQAIRQEEGAGRGLGFRDAVVIFTVSVLVIGLVGRDLRMGATFLLSLCVAVLVLLGLSWCVTRILPYGQFGFLSHQARLQFLRKPSRSQLLVVAIGLSLFFVETVLILGSSLGSQLNVANRSGIPNIFVLGVSDENTAKIEAEIPALQRVPVAQARIVELAGKPIAESELQDDDMERFYQTREYFITKRDNLGDGERLVAGESLFGSPTEGVVRLSLEEHFAEQVGLKLGDAIKIELAGVVLNAQVRSFRKVDWFNFRPNFFMIFSPDDIAGAPMDYVGFSRVKLDEIPNIQNRLGKLLPQVTVLDGQSLSVRLETMLRQLSFSVFAVSIFSMGSCLFVFIGITLSRRSELVKEVSLWKCLGLRSDRVAWIYILEALGTGVVGFTTSYLVSFAAVYVVCRWGIDIPMEIPPWIYFGGGVLLVPTIFAVGMALLISGMTRVSAAELIRSSENG